MDASLSNSFSHSLKRYLYTSLGFHAAIFIFLIVSPYLPFSAFHARNEKIVWVELPKGVTNQLGAPFQKTEQLPKTTIEEQKKALETPQKEQKKPSMTYQKKIPKESRIEDALARMEKQVSEKKILPEAAQIPNQQSGGFTGGTSQNYSVPTDPEYALYQMKVRQRIMNEWILPMKYTDAGLGLICRVSVHINDQGQIVGNEWETKSGNASFDLSAMRAVEKASPLDIPPDRLKSEVLNEGFIVEFKPQQVAP